MMERLSPRFMLQMILKFWQRPLSAYLSMDHGELLPMTLLRNTGRVGQLIKPARLRTVLLRVSVGRLVLAGYPVVTTLLSMR